MILIHVNAKSSLLLSTDCSPGYVGGDCSYQCLYPTYGTDCQRECNCSIEFCDIAIGCFSPKGSFLFFF